MNSESDLSDSLRTHDGWDLVRELRTERDDLRRRADYLNRQFNTAASALQTIARMPTRPRPDGTFNYSREAIIDIAQRAQAKIMEEASNTKGEECHLAVTDEPCVTVRAHSRFTKGEKDAR